jgi:GDPmannose 4,6-dehydratase
VQYSVRQFILWSAQELGIEIEFTGKGIDEIGTVKSINSDNNDLISVGDIIVRVDPRYFRPAEVETLLGDATKAKEDLGWIPEISVQEMCSEMVQNDLLEAKKTRMLLENGYNVNNPSEER